MLERLGVAGLVKRRSARLSQGEAYRVALVRSLLLGPDLVVLDEPVAHLDPSLAHEALDLVRESAEERGAAVLVSSHQLAELERVVTHLVLLHHGHVLLAGDLGSLLGGIVPALRIAARPIEKASDVLARHPAVARVEPLRADGLDLLRAELAGDAAASVNAALHAAGVEVSLLAPERPTVEELFRRTLARAGRAS
jgi:ABC-2 type transport system ATP-binding protein